MISIRVLRAAGLSSEQIVKVLELDESERRLTRREQNRINKQKQRSRQHVSTDLLTPMPDDFQPDLEWAMKEKDWTLERATLEAQCFRDHARGGGRVQADWPAAWRNWVRSPYRNNQKGSVNGRGQPRPHSREDREERTGAALAKLRAFAGGGGEAGELPAVGLPKPEKPA